MIRAVLTMDDVPSKNTPKIVEYLNENGIRAVMFAVGKNLERNPDEAVYALKNGMILGNHSQSHPSFSSLTEEDCISEIEQCEKRLDEIYLAANVVRRFRPFRFPYGDKGGRNRAMIQSYLAERGFSKLRDDSIPCPWWTENHLDKDIDTLWTYDFEEYKVQPGGGFTREDVWKKTRNPAPALGEALFAENGRHILLMHAFDETEEVWPGYYRELIDQLLENGVVFDEPAFFHEAAFGAEAFGSAQS